MNSTKTRTEPNWNWDQNMQNQTVAWTHEFEDTKQTWTRGSGIRKSVYVAFELHCYILLTLYNIMCVCVLCFMNYVWFWPLFSQRKFCFMLLVSFCYINMNIIIIVITEHCTALINSKLRRAVFKAVFKKVNFKRSFKGIKTRFTW